MVVGLAQIVRERLAVRTASQNTPAAQNRASGALNALRSLDDDVR